MAKEPINKSQAIRDALAANPGKSPKEISELLAEKGIKIPPTYISSIKSNAKAKRRKRKAGVGKGTKTAGQDRGNGLMAAVELVKASGGI